MNRWLDRMLGRIVQRGRLVVSWSDGSSSTYGDGAGASAALKFYDSAAEWSLAFNPELKLGELYMDRRITFPGDSVLQFVMLMNENWTALRKVPWVRALARARYSVRRITQNNDYLRARRNVAHHYDLDARLYRLFLDSDMQYSCAYFDGPDATLEEAQWAKKRHLASKLLLQDGQEILDIGSGWGGLGLFLAEQAGAKVTGVTLSTEQHRIANERARALGMERQARFELLDYRKLTGTFDRIVSVGMFEHVGSARYREFFRTVARLLKPDGVMVLHSIGRSDPPGTTAAWIAKYIFPGGYIPALSEVLRAIEEVGLFVTDIEILRLHYAETLKAWRARFRANRDEAERVYDERFCRMWDFYLAGSEASFRAGGNMVFQIQLAKKRDVAPLTRDYMQAAEADFEATRHAGESRLAAE